MVHILSEHGALPAHYERIAEIIQDFNPDMELAWIPPEERNAFDIKPFAIRHNPPNAPSYIVGFFSEEEMDHRIIAHLFSIDTTRNDVLGNLEREEAAKRALQMKEQIERDEMRKDFAKSLLKSRKHTYRHNGKKYT